MLLSCKNFMLPDFTRKKIFAQENDGGGGGGGGGGTAATCPLSLWPVACLNLLTLYHLFHDSENFMSLFGCPTIF